VSVTWQPSRLAAAGALILALSGCSATGGSGSSTAEPKPSEAADGHGHAAGVAAPPKPLREGERRTTLRMPEPYEPSAPTGAGTDDYRCFLLDPELDRPAYLTGTNVLPGNPDVVHHVILFRVPPDQVARAESMDAATTGQGWTCFGGTGLDPVESLDDAPWLGAWAPGGGESIHQKGYGVRLAPGSRIVMQVHYNLLAGTDEDVSATQLRLAPAEHRLTELRTMLMPAPVELPCREAHDDGPLCDRDAAIADVKERFGMAGGTADGLYFLCGGRPRPGNVQSCSRTMSQPATVRGVAGHMHLLGRSIKVEVNPGTDRAETILDIPVWDFDNQAAKPVPPYRLRAGDTVKVTCRHVQWLRDELPAFEGQPDRYVVWGEGTTDEMCLGILQVTRP
jgi:hypothetical protein